MLNSSPEIRILPLEHFYDAFRATPMRDLHPEVISAFHLHGLALLHTNEADWAQRTNEYGLRRPTHACQIFVYRAFDLWSQMGPMYRATVSVTQFMIPDEILWRIAVHWPDLGNHWHEASWRLHPVDDSRSASCLRDLIHSTYVLVMPGLLNEMAHRPHGLLESHRVTFAMFEQRCCPQGSICLSCKSSSRHFVGVDGLWCGALAPTIESP